MSIELWFRSLWKIWKHEARGPEKAPVGILAFEVSTIMCKLIHLWQSLTDKQISKLKTEIANSTGLKNLVSEDCDFLLELVGAEMSETLADVVRSVARLAKKCNEPSLQSFGHVFEGLVKLNADPYGWGLCSKKMEKKVKKMEWLICVNATMFQEMQILSELEQTMRRTNCDRNSQCNKVVMCKKQEVEALQRISLWNKSYDYTICLLARSVFTVFKRTRLVFGIYKEPAYIEELENPNPHYDNNSLYALMLSEKTNLALSLSRSMSISMTINSIFSQFQPSPTKPSNFYSCPLPISGNSSKPNPIFKRLTQVQPAMTTVTGILGDTKRRILLNGAPETLGRAALAQHYANVIIEIEKLSCSPDMIGEDARDELYSMLPTSVRRALRARLKKPCAAAKGVMECSILGSGVACEFRRAMSGIMEWLGPLAHGSVRWQAERSFEEVGNGGFGSGTKVFLVQTLHFANQEKCEAAIVELLVGLHYVWRFGREPSANAALVVGEPLDEYLDMQQR